MPAIGAYAPGKCILLGEHSVVYHRPAIAIPVTQVHAHAVVTARPTAKPGEILIQAPDIDLQADMDDLPQDHPLVHAVQVVLKELAPIQIPAFLLRITSTIPIASGLGSSAAVSVAIIRAVSTFFGRPLTDPIVSELAFQVEKIQHGDPSGVDNAVIAFSRPIYYVRNLPLEHLEVAIPLTLVIANTGISAPTASVVSDVRNQWQKNPSHSEAIFDAIKNLVNKARLLIENGPIDDLGSLMDANHEYLRGLNVSCPELDHLVASARSAGALGAKLSGSGRGGNMIALVKPAIAEQVSQSLIENGAKSIIITTLEQTG